MAHAPHLEWVANAFSAALAKWIHRSLVHSAAAFGLLGSGCWTGVSLAATPMEGTGTTKSWEWPGTPAELIRAVTQGAFAVMVRDFKPLFGIERLPAVKITNQCTLTAYTPKTATVCITPGMTQGLARIGDGALAYVVAHELAHHLQHAIPQLATGFTSRTQLELQADCLAGLLLARNRQVRFSETDVVEAFKAASKLGDRTYDHWNHHGTGEMRQLAIRSGVRFGLTNKRDNYFSLMCGLNTRGAKDSVSR